MRFVSDKYSYALSLLLNAGVSRVEAEAIARDVARDALAKGYRKC